MKIIQTLFILLLASVSVFAADRTIKTDIVVVGAGATGLSAAVKAAQGGAQVVLLEKNPFLGGGSTFAEGLFGAETNAQRLVGHRLERDEAYRHIIEANQANINAELTRKFVYGSAASLDWLEKQGIRFNPVQISVSEPRAWHLVEDNGRFVHGAGLTTVLEQRAVEAGVMILRRTPAKSLIYDGAKVGGVIAQDAKGNKITITARAVLLATGGFNNSPEKIREWTHYDPDYYKPTLPLNKTGDGIQMAMDIGADTEGLGLMLHTATEGRNIVPLGNLWSLSWQPYLWVNKYGKRFVNEDVVFGFVHSANAISRQRDYHAWAVFDEGDIQYAEEMGIDNGVGVLVPIGTKLVNLRSEIAYAEKNGSDGFYSASSLDELARKLGMEASVLKSTVSEYNRQAATGLDRQYGKPETWLKPVEGKKFYALKLTASHFTSIGGLRVTPDMEVTDKNDQVIPGLYAGGCDVGGLHNSSYTLWASGHAFGFAAFSGQAAADSMLKYIGKRK